MLLRWWGGASGTLPLEETCSCEGGDVMVALAGLVPGHYIVVLLPCTHKIVK